MQTSLSIHSFNRAFPPSPSSNPQAGRRARGELLQTSPIPLRSKVLFPAGVSGISCAECPYAIDPRSACRKIESKLSELKVSEAKAEAKEYPKPSPSRRTCQIDVYSGNKRPAVDRGRTGMIESNHRNQALALTKPRELCNHRSGTKRISLRPF